MIKYLPPPQWTAAALIVLSLTGLTTKEVAAAPASLVAASSSGSHSRTPDLNLIWPGRNYGWPIVEGIGDTDNGRLTNPLITFPTADAGPAGIAISGNTLYMAGLTGQRLYTMPLIKGRIGEPKVYFPGVYGRLRTVEIAPDGALWLTTSNHPRQPPRGRRSRPAFPHAVTKSPPPVSPMTRSPTGPGHPGPP